MFRPTDPQISLLESQFLLPKEKVDRLQASWAHDFQKRVLPLIDEEVFRDAFSEDNGRPNKSIRLLLGLHLLKEWDDLTDRQVLDQLEFNLQWHYALAVEPSAAHICQKTLYNFRQLMMESDRAQELFKAVARGLVEMDGLGVGRQRLDSMHVIPNIAILTRLGLFVETVTGFMRELRREYPEKLEELDGGYRNRYLDREGYFADAKRDQARRRLPAVARDIWRLVVVFESDEEVGELSSYQLLARLLEEQCEVPDVSGEDVPAAIVVGEDSGDAELPVVVAAEAHEEAGGRERSALQDQPKSTVANEGTRRPSEDRAGLEPSSDVSDAKASPSRSADEPEDKGEKDPRDPSKQEAQPAEQEPCSAPAKSPEPVKLKEGREIGSDSLQTPHDPDATYGHKGKGYEVQVAESCEEDNPYQIITGVEINGANESDQHATIPMLEQLSDSGLQPKELVADTNYGGGEKIVQCAEMGVHLNAPVHDPNASRPPDPWEFPVEATEPEGLGKSSALSSPLDSKDKLECVIGLEHFNFTDTFDQVRTCPSGHAPLHQHLDKAQRNLFVTFSASDCDACPLRHACPARTKKGGDRTLRFGRPTAATAHRQALQQTKAFKDGYKIRSGVESTNAELKGRHGARNLRVRGRNRVRLAMILKAMAVNTKRAVQYHAEKLNKPLRTGLSDAPALP